MHHSIRRARRAAAVLTLAGLATVAGATSVPGSADASSPQPRVSVRVRNRTLFVDGGRAADLIALRSPAATPFVVVVDLGNDGTAQATVHRNRIDEIVIRAGDGDDDVLIDESAGVGVPFTDTIPTSFRGQEGNDVLRGGAGIEEFRGGPGNDVVDGNKGNDIASLDSGDDEFIWDPGDGNDIIEGRSGRDVMTFNGAAGNETFTATPDGGRLRFTRNVGNIVMDTDGVEQVDVNALGGSDFVEIDDLRRTDVDAVNVDEGLTLGAAGADGVIDSVFVDGTDRADAITIGSDPADAGTVTIGGLATTVTVTDAETIDRLLISSGDGRDVVDAAALAAESMHLDVLTGKGDDAVFGGAGSETVNTGPGRDVVDGNRGNDTADLEEGDDEFIWDPGDGSDIIEGRDGFDVMTFNGSTGDEIFAATPVGERMAFTRNLGNIRMDTASVEQVDLNALAGADQLTVEDLTGTAVSIVDVNLGAAIGAVGGDSALDAITVRGTAGDDLVGVTGGSGAVRVDGLVNTLDIVNAEPSDTLTFLGNGGTDSVDSAGLAQDTILLTIA